jgi:membrane fusion protein (multidrug efflux system)
MNDSPKAPEPETVPAPEPEAVPPSPPAVARRRWLRPALLLLGPLLVLRAGGYFYLSSGRYVGTDNAYLKADLVIVAARVEGQITAVMVDDNDRVEAGDVLFRLDPAPFELAAAEAEARLQEARQTVLALKASYREKQAELEMAAEDVAFAERDYTRQADLAKSDFVSASTLDIARHTLENSRQKQVVIARDLDRLRAGLGGDPARHAEVRAPFAGIASNTPKVGRYVQPGQAVMSLVGEQKVWIEANFKETELTHIRPGQAATVTVDAYPGERWQGTVQSINQATEAEFSVLPAQNASGNWVKVVQRVPVRIKVEPRPDGPPLRAGMSSLVEVDTGQGPALPGVVERALAWLGAPAANAGDEPAAGAKAGP